MWVPCPRRRGKTPRFEQVILRAREEIPRGISVTGNSKLCRKRGTYKKWEGPTIYKTSPILGSRQDDYRPSPLLSHTYRDQHQSRTDDVQPLREIMESVKHDGNATRNPITINVDHKMYPAKRTAGDLYEMGDAQLCDGLDKAEGDSERCKMITKILRDRSIACATGKQKTLTVPLAKAKTPAFRLPHLITPQ